MTARRLAIRAVERLPDFTRSGCTSYDRLDRKGKRSKQGTVQEFVLSCPSLESRIGLGFGCFGVNSCRWCFVIIGDEDMKFVCFKESTNLKTPSDEVGGVEFGDVGHVKGDQHVFRIGEVKDRGEFRGGR